VYLAVAIASLVFAWSGPKPGRGLLINLSVAFGFVGLAMMVFQFALVACFKTAAAPFGIDVVLQYHRQMAYVALLFILAHPILLFLEDSRSLALLVLACFLFAPAQGGQAPEPQRNARRPNHHFSVNHPARRRGVRPERGRSKLVASSERRYGWR